MDEPDWEALELREIVTFAPPGGEVRLDEYPWLAAARLVAQGGDGGAAADGTPGEPGQLAMAAYTRQQLPDVLRVNVSRGGHGSGGGQDGRDGFVLIELWARSQLDPSAS